MREPTANLAALLVVAACAAAGPAAAEPQLRFDGDSSSVAFPVDLRGNLITVRGRIGDSDSLAIVLDSGASGSALDDGWARAHGIAVHGHVESRGSGGTVAGSEVSGLVLRLPGFTFAGVDAAVIPLASVGAPSGRALDAVLGQPLLRRAVVTVDYAAGLVRLTRPDAYRAPAGATILPLTYDQELPYVTGRVTLPGRTAVEGRFVIDTGSSQCVILAESFVREQKALATMPATISGRGRGVGGVSSNPVGRLERVELGGLEIARPIAMLRTGTTGVIAAPGAIGNLGGELLRRFTVTFDEPHRRLILVPNAHRDEPFEADMSGLVLRWAPDSTRTLLVEAVDPGSPADSAGIREGDRIETFDGAPASTLDLFAIRAGMRVADQRHDLTLTRGAETLTRAFTTRRRI